MSTRSFSMSADGTSIAYDTRGAGPGLVLLSGSVLPPEQYDAVADVLAATFTVHVVHRRGRGASGPQRPGHRIERECEDARAVLQDTGATVLFGHSLGGLVALQTALHEAVAHQLAALVVFDPAISVAGSLPMDYLPAFNRAINAGKLARAWTILSRGLRVGGRLDTIPEPAARAFNWVLLHTVARALHATLPTVTAEAAAAEQLEGLDTSYDRVSTATTIIIGGRSPGYFRSAAEAVVEHMSDARLQVLPKLDHNGPVFGPREVAATVETAVQAAMG